MVSGAWTDDGRHFLVVTHPSMMADMRRRDPRAEWKAKHRAERLARRGVIEAPIQGKLGVIEGIRIRE